MYLVNAVRTHAMKKGNEHALIYHDKCYSYSELYAEIKAKAKFYQELDINSIMIVMGNSPELIISLLAAEMNEANVVLVGPELKFYELESLITHSNVEFVEYLKEPSDIYCGLILAHNELKLYRNIGHRSERRHESFLVKATSGSSGSSKLAVRTQKSVLKELDLTLKKGRLKSNAKFVCIPPLYHSFGLIAGALLPLYYGKTLILYKEFIPSEILKAIELYQADILFAVGYMYEALIREIKRHQDIYDTSSLKKAFSAGMKLKEDVIQDFYILTGVPIWNDYGSTETGILCLNTDTLSNPNSIGKTVSGQAYILDGEGNVLDQGEEGFLLIKRDDIEPSYLFPTNIKVKKGEYLTGDIGFMDDQNNIYLTGRADDVFNIYGKKVSASEVKAILLKHPYISDAVVMQHTPNRMKAYLTLEQPMAKSDVLKFCSEYLPLYKVPDEVEFLIDLPRNKTGKVLKKYLKEDKV